MAQQMVGDYENGYLIAFANRETADEWWRMISASSSPYSGTVERISPQLYIQNRYSAVSLVLFPSPSVFPDALHFNKRMFITILDRTSYNLYKQIPVALSPVALTDHISGKWYFVRSKADPFSHWYLRTGGTCVICGDADCDAIHISSEYRTRFCVRVRNLAAVPDNFVMIGKDEISITGPKGHTVHINDEGDLKAMTGYQGETDLFFGDLENRFVTRAERQINGEVWEYVESVERGAGEVWELVR